MLELLKKIDIPGRVALWLVGKMVNAWAPTGREFGMAILIAWIGTAVYSVLWFAVLLSVYLGVRSLI